MWTKRFGVWVRGRGRGASRAAEVPQAAWEQAERDGREVLSISSMKKSELHMVQPEIKAENFQRAEAV